MAEITLLSSRKNEILRRASQLGSSAEMRRETGLFLAEGARLCRDAVRSGLLVREVYYTEHAEKKYAEYLREILPASQKVYQVAEHAAGLLSQTKNSQGIFCVCEKRQDEMWELSQRGDMSHVLLLENVQDPGNLGTVFRTAEALGIFSVGLCGDCCDLYSPKVLRSSMGAVFRIRTSLFPSLEQACDCFRSSGIPVYAAVPDADAIPVTKLDFSHCAVIAVGNEGNGLSEEGIRACTASVTIPMGGRAESLNAASSAAILMWEMVRKRSCESDA